MRISFAGKPMASFDDQVTNCPALSSIIKSVTCPIAPSLVWMRPTSHAIPERFGSSSEKVLVNFAYWTDAKFSKNGNARDMALAKRTAFLESNSMKNGT